MIARRLERAKKKLQHPGPPRGGAKLGTKEKGLALGLHVEREKSGPQHARGASAKKRRTQGFPAGERREKNFSTPGFARLPLLLLPEGEGVKKR